MSFELGHPTLLLVALLAAIAVEVGLLAAVGVAVVRRNRSVRLARHESVGHYYGRLVLGH